MSRKLIQYGLIAVAAIVVLLVLLWLLFSGNSTAPCVGCVVTSLPQQRQECEKQFMGGSGAPRVLQPGSVDEYLIGFFDPSMGGGGGYSSSGPSGYSSTSVSSGPAPTAGYVIARARPQTSYDANTGSYAGGQFNPATVTPGQAWDDVRMAVVSYVSPLRNESICAEKSVKFFEDKFEAYCDLPTRFTTQDPPKLSYRVFVMNDSNTPVEYCIVSNCDQSHGKVCQLEMATPQ